VWEQVSPRLVFGKTTSQPAQFANSGNAHAAILALSLVLTPAMKQQGRYSVIPPEMYPPIRQGAVIIKKSAHKTLASRFIEFLKPPKTRPLFIQYGFQKPNTPQ